MLKRILLERSKVGDWTSFPFSIPAISSLQEITLSHSVCFFEGENGSGKSTLLEAIANVYGFSNEGGSKHTSRRREAEVSVRALANVLRLGWSQKPLGGYYLRAESFFNIASYIDELQESDSRAYTPYGGRSLHEQSHGESFLALFQHRLSEGGFYLLDEPESALSPQRQLSFLVLLHQLVGEGSQFIIATHSPILLAYPESQILSFTSGEIRQVSYWDTGAYQVTSGFLQDPTTYLRHLLS